MKIILNSKVRRQQGVALMITVIIVLIGAATLASYLLLTENEASSVGRSQMWNNSMTLTEAGVEEALAFMNKYEGSFSMITNWATPASAAQDGWTVNGNIYTMTRTVSTNSGYFTVKIDNSNPDQPSITSQGYAYTYFSSAQSPFMLAQVGATLPSSGPSTTLRTVKVTTVWSPLFPDAIDSIKPINLNGNNVVVDSFNSTNPAYSDMTSYGYGTYDSAKAEAHGNVSTDSKIFDALNVGNANIYGKVNTGPGGTISINNNGYVGPLPQQGSGIQPGYSNDTMNVTFPDVVLPANASSWWSVPSTYVITNSGYYYLPSISFSGWQNLDIEAPNVTIYVAGNISMTGHSSITLGTNVVNVTMYVAGPTVSIGGNGVQNNTYHASAFSLYGLPSLTSMSLQGNGVFAGTVYAPEAAFSYGSSGNTGTYVGALVANSVTLGGTSNFHYDESLATTGPARGFIPTGWTEVGAN